MSSPVLLSNSLYGSGSSVALHDVAVSRLSEMIGFLGRILVPIILIHRRGTGVKLAI